MKEEAGNKITELGQDSNYSLDDEFKKLSGGNKELDDYLLELKAKLNTGKM